MAKTTAYTIAFEDGSSAEYRIKPRHLVRYETEVGSFDEATMTIKNGFMLAWYAADRPGCPASATKEQRSAAFMEWLDTVDEISTDGDEDPESVELAGEAGVESVPTE